MYKKKLEKEVREYLNNYFPDNNKSEINIDIWNNYDIWNEDNNINNYNINYDYDILLDNTINKIVIEINNIKINIKKNINNILYLMYYNTNNKFDNQIIMLYKILANNYNCLKNISQNVCNDYIQNYFEYYEIRLINNSLKYLYNSDL
tara:strand:- start:298 stop:741 length:444 start_codon:yes stop_codon:yes gene_type:complete